MKYYLLLSLLFAGVCFTTKAQTIVRGPYLQCPTPTAIKIKWRTDVACIGEIKYATVGNSLTQSVSETTATTDHTLFLQGLQPYTQYQYAVYQNSSLIEGDDANHRFRTFPVADSVLPIKAWVIGDFGKGNSRQQLVRDAFTQYDANRETDLWLWLGDNVYDSGTDAEFQTKVFDSVYGYQKMMKYLPFLPIPGNHDYNVISPVTASQPPLQHAGPYYDLADVPTQAEAGGIASGNELYYSYDYGNVHFLAINSEIGSLYSNNDDWIGIRLFGTFTSSPFTDWLHADLQANTKPWVIAYFHQPPHTDGSHDSGAFWEVYMKAMRENITPILEQYGVDLVMSGHSHVYERSYLMKGFYGDLATFDASTMLLQAQSGVDSVGEAYIKYTQGANPNQGTVYVVNGNSGSAETAPTLQHPAMKAGYGCDTCIGSFLLEINGNRLDGKHLDAYGNFRDHFTIYKFNTSNGIGTAYQDITNLTVMPNPFSHQFQILFSLEKTQNLQITLTSLDGKVIPLASDVYTSGEKRLTFETDALSLKTGIYLLSIKNETEVVSQKMVKVE